MKVLVTLSSLLLCEALGALLSGIEKGYRVFATNDADQVGNFIPDVIIVDEHTLILNLEERWPQAKVILLDTGLDEDEIITFLLNHTLDGVIKTSSNLDLFKKALRAVDDGQIWIDNSRIKAILKHAESLSASQPEPGLSKKEREIIMLIAQGHRNREIAGTLSISEQTVKSHISRIFRKRNINCRSQLVPLAMKLKLASLE
jgi:LuxR family transcriptional regulator, positive regulator of biofilm formation